MILYRSFFQRFGHLGVCVLPAEALSGDLLRVDPETHAMPPSLRQSVSVLGLCFARVLRACADGLYWADVAATPDLVDAQRVLLTEEHLYSALPWDIRLVDKCPGDIRDLLFAHAQEVQPVQQQAIDQVSVLTPAPLVPLVPLEEAAVVVTVGELQEALDPQASDSERFDDPGNDLFKRITRKPRRSRSHRPRVGSFTMQQAFLRAMLDALMAQLYQAHDQATAQLLKARCGVLALLQRWHRFTRQRVVNAVPVWSEERHGVLWQLTVGVPETSWEVLA
jgi:hypothetical protein